MGGRDSFFIIRRVGIACQAIGSSVRIIHRRVGQYHYLQMYGNDAKSLSERLDRIRATAHAIIVKIEQALGAAQESEEQAA